MICSLPPATDDDVHVAVDVHQDVFEEGEPVRQVRGRGDVAVRHGSDIATCDVVFELSLKQGCARNLGPRMSVVLLCDREVIRLRD